jgi:hypothetical protein
MVVWSVLLVVVIVIFVCVDAVILPKAFLFVGYNVTDSSDRGIKTIDEDNGRSIIYEPDFSVRKYISQYILSERDGKKFLVCKFDGNVGYINFDVVLFNQFGEVENVLNVKQIVGDNLISKPLQIPMSTAYVSLVLTDVNGKKFPNNVVKPISGKRIFWYCVCSTLTILAGIVCVKFCCAELLGGVFDEMFLVSSYSNMVTAIIAAALILLNVLSAIIIIKSRNRRVRGKVKNAKV